MSRMHIQYDRQIDEISSDDLRPNLYYQNERNPTGPDFRWPKVIGIIEIISGFITAMLGTLEVFLVPMTDNITSVHVIYLDKTNCYGFGIFSGLMMIITGSTAIRASISKRASTVYRFYTLTMLTLIIYTFLTLFLISAYSFGWTAKSQYPVGSHIHEVHIFLTASMVLGLMFVTAAFVTYYEQVFCGEMQLGLRWMHCLFCCFFREPNRSRHGTVLTQSLHQQREGLAI